MKKAKEKRGNSQGQEEENHHCYLDRNTCCSEWLRGSAQAHRATGPPLQPRSKGESDAIATKPIKSPPKSSKIQYFSLASRSGVAPLAAGPTSS